MKKILHIFYQLVAIVKKSKITGSVLNILKVDENKNKKLLLLRRIKIQTRLMVSFTLLLLLVLGVTGMIAYNKSAKTIDEKVRTYSMQVINQTGTILKNEINKMEVYTTEIAFSSEIQQQIDRHDVSKDYDEFDANLKIQENINSKFILENDVESCIIFNSKDMSVIASYGLGLKPVQQFNRSDKRTARWMEFENTIGGKSLGIQRPIVSLKIGKDIGSIVLIPKSNYLAKHYSELDIGIDKKSNKPFDIFAIDANAKIISSRSEAFQIGSTTDQTKNILKKISKTESGNVDMAVNGKDCLVTYSSISKDGWYLVAAIPQEYLNSSAKELGTTIILIGFGCLIIAFILCLAIARSVAAPSIRLGNEMKKAKLGDLTVNVKDVGNDEIFELSNNFNEMMLQLNSFVSKVQKSSHRVLDFSNKISVASESTYNVSEQVAITIEQITRGATDQATEISSSASNMNRLSDEINHVGTNMQDVSNIVNEISNLNKDVSKTIKVLNEKSYKVSDATDRISVNINNLSKNMNEIQKILKMMIGISEQINLLSLNAAIEAARAGEAGRGFAVVANEVKKLADQSKEFTGFIGSIVANIQRDTSSTVHEVSDATSVIHEQLDAVKETGNMFETVFVAMDDVIVSINKTEKAVIHIMNSKDKVLESMENISAVAEESAATTEEISASTEEQMAAAEELSNYARTLKTMSDELDDSLSFFKIEQEH